MTDSISEEFLGFALNVSQKLAVRTALKKLRINENKPDISFWGKITGTTRDYFIAQGTSFSDRITKSYYVSSDEGVSFSKLPEVDEFILSKIQHAKGLFTGNPANLYKDPNAPATEEEEEEPEEDEDEGDEPKPEDPSKRKLTELERLAHTVSTIDNDTCVVPRGAYVMTPTGLIQKTKGFEGLKASECTQLSNFLLFRDPQSAQTLATIRKLGVTNNADFLDGVMDDQPAGVWVVQVDEGLTTAKLRSLVWQGYELKHQIGSSNFVGGYFGNGLKNEDVMFML